MMAFERNVGGLDRIGRAVGAILLALVAVRAHKRKYLDYFQPGRPIVAFSATTALVPRYYGGKESQYSV